MSKISTIFIGMTTRNSNDSGTDSPIVFIANEGGTERIQYTFPDSSQDDQGQGKANLYEIPVIPGAGLDTTLLANTYFRVGIRESDAWRPEHVFLWGMSEKPHVIFPLGMRFDASTTLLEREAGGGGFAQPNPEQVVLSTDVNKGDLSFPIPPVAPGGPAMPIQRLVMMMTTSNKANAGTNSKVNLQVTSANALLVDFNIPHTPQDDQQRGQANFYFIPVGDPFMKNQLDPENSITLSINGDDTWLPASFYLFGLDTADGMANSAVPLVFIDAWAFNNSLSTDDTEGSASVKLTLTLP